MRKWHYTVINEYPSCPTCTHMMNAFCCNVRTDKLIDHGNCMGRSKGLKDKTPSPLNLHAKPTSEVKLEINNIICIIL